MCTTFCRTFTKDKIRLDGLLFEPDQKSRTGVLHIHGMAGNFYENPFVDAMADEYTKAGYAFLTVNTRGHDAIADFTVKHKKEKFVRYGNVFEKFEDCLLDIDAWLKFFKSKGYQRIILQGHSLGASKVVYYLDQRPRTKFKCLILATPTDMLGFSRTGSRIREFRLLLKEAKMLVAKEQSRTILSKPLGGWSYLSAETFLNLFSDESSANIFPRLKKGEFKALAKVRIPVLAFFGNRDAGVIFSAKKDLAMTAQYLQNKKSKTFVVDQGTHVYFKREKQVAREVVRWLTSLN